MSKRFIDTEIFNDSWFMDLSPEHKLFYIYLFTNCDHAGIIDLNIRLAEFQTGIKGLLNSFGTVTKLFTEKRIKRLQDGKYFLPKFLVFQYPNGLSDNVKQQKSVIETLKKHSIDFNSYETVTKELNGSSLTPQDIYIYKDIYKDIIEGVGEIFTEVKIELVNGLMEWFGFNEIANQDKQKFIYHFLKVLQSTGKTEYFEKQFIAYKTAKSKSGEIKHGLPGFCGTFEKQFLDGGWNAKNWEKEITEPVNGKQQTGILKAKGFINA